MARRKSRKQRAQKRRQIAGGEACPKCDSIMKRYEHMPDWKPPANAPHWFLWWDLCRVCNHTQHYEAAKVRIADQEPSVGAGERQHINVSEASASRPMWKISSVDVGIGSRCPKCDQVMRRYEHGPGWEPRPGASQYFRWWDACPSCRHMQHYDAAKVRVSKHMEANA